MNCQELETIILGMARAQLLEASARRQALAHIARCEDCAERLAEQQELTAAVRAAGRNLRSEEASAHVEQSLLAAFRKQANVAPARSPKPIRARQWPKLALAAAAIVLLALLAGAIRQWQVADPGQKTAIVPTAPDKNEKSPEGFLPTVQPERKAVRHFAGQRRQAQSSIPRDATSGEEVVTEFISLAGENELVPLESGQVLRVELPTSTLISMGLPITTEDVSKPVLADLLVGQDGLARAIRFVRPGEAAYTGSPQQPNNK